MKREALDLYACPRCQCELELSAGTEDGPEVLDGFLVCRGCEAVHPIRKGVPRFVSVDGYAYSFGRQWNWFRTVQLDSQNGTLESANTLSTTTGWTRRDYEGRRVL